MGQAGRATEKLKTMTPVDNGEDSGHRGLTRENLKEKPKIGLGELL